MDEKQLAKRPTDKLRELLDDPVVQDQFRKAMAERAEAFTASIIELVSTDNGLAECPPGAVLKEALKAATLDIPLNRALGFAYILPFNTKVGDKWVKMPQFIPGYKLFIQLALRTREYRKLNADIVYEGQTVSIDTLTGDVSITGAPASEKAQGYVAYFELINGFRKARYMTVSQVTAHAQKYSKTWSAKDNRFMGGSPWEKEFDQMGLKTVLKGLLSKYGPLSISSPLTDLLSQEDEDNLHEELVTEANREALEPPKADPQEPAKAPF